MDYSTKDERTTKGVEVFDLYKKGQKVATVAEIDGELLTKFVDENERNELIKFQERNEFEDFDMMVLDILAYSPELGIDSMPDWESMPV